MCTGCMELTQFIHDSRDYAVNSEIKEALLKTLKNFDSVEISSEAQGVLLITLGASLLDWKDC